MKWIAIKDQLPPVGKEVLFYFPASFEIGKMCADKMFSFKRKKACVYPGTHWAEITPPEIGETK